jgi:hypothetical protein
LKRRPLYVVDESLGFQKELPTRDM